MLTYRVVIEFNTLSRHQTSIRLHQNGKKKHTLVGVRARRLVVWVTHVRLEMKRGGAGPAAAIEMSKKETVIR